MPKMKSGSGAKKRFKVTGTGKILRRRRHRTTPPGHLITTVVDVRDHLDAKRRAMQAHASQIAETSFFLAMPPEAFEAVWGQEEYILRGAPSGTRETELFEGVD